LPRVEELRALAGVALLAVDRSPVPPGWETAWHEHVERVEVGGFGIRPPWLDGRPDDLLIDPGTSFGVANHQTTRLGLELLAELPAGGPLCDWGAGSGVLAIAAARRGFSPVSGVEIDAEAVAAARANAVLNGVDVRFEVGDVTQCAPYAPTVVANLTLPLLRAVRLQRVPERMVVSGVLATDDVPTFGLQVVRRRVRDGWMGLLLA
jgi:ribosomal protein L11 methyltransferase